MFIFGRFCCKKILLIRARKIDSRLGALAQRTLIERSRWRTCVGSLASMPLITMGREFIAHSTKMPRSIGRLSASALSHHCLSSAVFITNIAESDFRHTQLDQLMHTARSSSRVRLARRHDPLVPTQLPQFIFEQGQRSGGADRVPAHRYTAATNSANFLRA